LKEKKSYSILSIVGTTSTNNDVISLTKEKAKGKSKKVQRFFGGAIQKAMTTKLRTC
jgi:hypothetical protein